jgi:hypothetical protein
MLMQVCNAYEQQAAFPAPLSGAARLHGRI